MIGQDQLAESARYMDAMAEEHGFVKWAELSNIDAKAMLYVAEQRALRAAMMMDGQDPRLLSRTEKTNVVLSDRAQELMPHLTGMAMDGMGIGVHAGRLSV